MHQGGSSPPSKVIYRGMCLHSVFGGGVSHLQSGFQTFTWRNRKFEFWMDPYLVIFNKVEDLKGGDGVHRSPNLKGALTNYRLFSEVSASKLPRRKQPRGGCLRIEAASRKAASMLGAIPSAPNPGGGAVLSDGLE
jgi:hypothetical protein